MPEFAVEFTSENQVVCGGSKCNKLITPAESFYLHNSNPKLPGRRVCTNCYHRYTGKNTTRRIEGDGSSFPECIANY
jgi:hypothetical protein